MGAVGHILGDAGSAPLWWLAAVAVAAALIVEHHLVAGFDGTELRRRSRIAVSALVILALSTLVAPTSTAQPAGALLPDLISDPPAPSIFKELTAEDGSTQLVLTFDGYVHNIGEGPLDVMGNPQLPGGMTQRVQTNGTWQDIGTPTVRFEVDDGHNHFHLIEVVEYVLWNELQGAQTALGSKIGFCLVDSEQVEAGVEETYSEEGNKFCEEDNPSATELHMGISPGWRDVYDATTTLQWVDVSSVSPGRYWIGAITDPNDEIVESNEENNELVFSERTVSIPGYSPREQHVEFDQGVESVEVTLTSSTHGTVGAPVYVIEQGPLVGSLNVPVGAELSSPVITYFPGPDFAGSAEIIFSVHDGTSVYPLVAPTNLVRLSSAGAGAPAAAELGAPPLLSLPSTFFETTDGEASQVQVTATRVTGEPARVFAIGLPRGLVADSQTGLISGVALDEGIFEVEIIALGAIPSESTSQTVSWIVNPAPQEARLLDPADLSTPVGELARVPISQNALEQEIAVRGLPSGISLEEGNGALRGIATEVGDFEIVIERVVEDEVVDEATFVWTIRPGLSIDFVL